jgi:hypothetical protein
MNRRSFIQSVAALVSLPANPLLSLQPAGAAVAAASVVPAEARSWAIYMHNLHGECPPRALQALLNIPEVDASRYLKQLVADGVIRPNPLLKKSVSRLVKPTHSSLPDEAMQRLEKDLRSTAANGQSAEPQAASQAPDHGLQPAEEPATTAPETVIESEPGEQRQATELQATEPQSSTRRA